MLFLFCVQAQTFPSASLGPVVVASCSVHSRLYADASCNDIQCLAVHKHCFRSFVGLFFVQLQAVNEH